MNGEYKMVTDLEFKFKFLDDEGNESGFMATKGRLSPDTLTLGDDEYPSDADEK